MKNSNQNPGELKPKPVLPIDIHYNKLLDWLIDRRHCNVNWAADAVVIRGKINSAVSLPLVDIPNNDKLNHLLSIPHLNFFHILQIIELLEVTEKEKKNFLGQCTSPILNAWTEISNLYHKNGVFLAEAAQQLIRFVNYEIAALKKSFEKNKKAIQDFERKEVEYDQQIAQIDDAFKSKCRRLGIDGYHVKQELLKQLEDLPRLYDDVASDCHQLKNVYDLYVSFLEFLGVTDKNVLPMVKHILDKGNTTVFEYQFGHAPSRTVVPVVEGLDLDIQDDEAKNDIDWGDIDVNDAGDADSQMMEIADIAWEAPDGVSDENEIDWGSIDVTSGVNDALDLEVIGDSNVSTDGEDVAMGKDALTLLENPETRSNFLNELAEIESFLQQRLIELRRDDDILAANQFQNSSTVLQSADEKKVDSLLHLVLKVKRGLETEKVVQLGLIKANPRSLDRLVEGVSNFSTLSERIRRNRDHIAFKRLEAENENTGIIPQIQTLKVKTKELQKRLEEEISKKYDDRPVNIMGDINMI